ncbi:hypothetical protein C3F09_11690 [candidate division GN15 bacterium]|uniref:PorV/PorQ family protein n=1 Tax=candidate division GN15 bacterium TaxID=2072418 RepID=A0A855WY38_9BACT|nr:MAG: hypothetical protein C3F09_11690 [candidate division GN15 bacterium]
MRKIIPVSPVAVIAVVLIVLGPGVTRVAAKSINSNVGTSAFPFLKINIGARSCGMAGAFTGLADDESALYYNPSGIAFLEGKRFIFEYHNYFADLQSGFVGFIRPIWRDKMLGISIDYLNYGDFIKTDLTGNNLGTFGGSDVMLSTSLAVKQSDYIAYGGSLKFIYEKLDRFSATGVAVDLSAKYLGDRSRYSAGIMVQNIGFQLSALGTEKDKLPLTVRAGGAIKPRGLPLRVAADVIVPIDNGIDFAIGTEYFALKPFYIRIGWNTFGTNYRIEGSTDKWAGLGVGVGFDYRKMQISYAYTPAADLGESHRITVSGGF